MRTTLPSLLPHPASGTSTFWLPNQTYSSDYDSRSEVWFFDFIRSAMIESREKRSMSLSYGGESEYKSGGMVDLGLGDSESIVPKMNSSFESTGSAASVSNLPAVTGGSGEEPGLVQVQDLKATLPLWNLLEGVCGEFKHVQALFTIWN